MKTELEYNKKQTKLQNLIDFHYDHSKTEIKWNEFSQLESVYKNNYIASRLEERAQYLHKWLLCRDMDVYISKQSFNYALVDNFHLMDSLNKGYFDTEKSIVFTEEVFDRLCFYYINYQVERLTKELIENSITNNSTSKIHNLVFEWELECKQKMIQYFKEINEIN